MSGTKPTAGGVASPIADILRAHNEAIVARAPSPARDKLEAKGHIAGEALGRAAEEIQNGLRSWAEIFTIFQMHGRTPGLLVEGVYASGSRGFIDSITSARIAREYLDQFIRLHGEIKEEGDALRIEEDRARVFGRGYPALDALEARTKQPSLRAKP